MSEHLADVFGQGSYGVRLEWGAAGAATLAPGCTALVIVDVLSFTTSVCVAAERGTRSFPTRGVTSPLRTSPARTTQNSLPGAGPARPGSRGHCRLRRCAGAPAAERLVLPSPNGSAIAAAAARSAAGSAPGRGISAPAAPVIVAACLRNGAAIGRRLAEQGTGTPGRPVAVIPAGERWPDGSLRPALEDLLGAGAVITALRDAGAGPLSPEAAAAAACFTGTPDVGAALTACASGAELRARGFAEDVEIAAAAGASSVVPVLQDGAFTAAS